MSAINERKGRQAELRVNRKSKVRYKKKGWDIFLNVRGSQERENPNPRGGGKANLEKKKTEAGGGKDQQGIGKTVALGPG